jgi:5-methylcytosine-specific restriction endonuclease McrA
LNEPVLWLNRNWQVIGCFPVRTSIENLMRDQAAAMDPESCVMMTFDEWRDHEPRDARWIKTANKPVPVPEVIILKEYGERPPQRVGFNRPNLFRRDDHSCQYCGQQLPGSKLQIEHVVPRSRGGPTTWDNCVAACDACNSAKADKTPREAGMKLRKKPTTPSWKPGVRIPRGEVLASWVPFLKKERVA